MKNSKQFLAIATLALVGLSTTASAACMHSKAHKANGASAKHAEKMHKCKECDSKHKLEDAMMKDHKSNDSYNQE